MDFRSVLTRFAEPSSWSSLAALLAIAGVNVPSGLWQAITLAGSGIAGVVGFFLPEGSKPVAK
jgi:hypothetical protein